MIERELTELYREEEKAPKKKKKNKRMRYISETESAPIDDLEFIERYPTPPPSVKENVPKAIE